MFTAYENLANAIIVCAANDYRKALKELKQNSSYVPAIIMKNDCERFFASEWFSALSKVDGNRLMRMLREEVA